jgi:hypothetical protein
MRSLDRFSCFLIVELDGITYYAHPAWVRPQYNEPLEVLTVLIFSTFCFSI